MKILGISAYYHDSAAAILSDNTIMAAVQEERFSRIKHDPSFPSMSIKYCLKHSGLMLNNLDAIVFYDKPFLKFERLIETYYNNGPKGFKSFVKSMPVWLKEKLFIRKLLSEELLKIDSQFKASKAKFLFSEHHLSHAASAFYASGFENAAILTIDGVGEWATASISAGTGKEINILKELHFPDSVGLLYSAFTYFLGFKVNSGEYKMMGLAPYGNIKSPQTKHFISLIKDQLITIYDNGSIRLDQKFFNYAVGLKMIRPLPWQSLFGLSPRSPQDPIEQSHCNLALAIQAVTEQIIELMAKHTKALTDAQNLCLAGGVALNSVANGKLERSKLFKNIFIQPAAGDAGGALGAALAANHIYFKKERILLDNQRDIMQNDLLGPEYSDQEIMQTIRRFNARYKQYAMGELNRSVAFSLNEGKVVGWFQGRMEFGPRALGSRSILASPLIADMQKRLNLKIKFREGFRPFAALTTIEDENTYFDSNVASPYMLFVQSINENFKCELPRDYDVFSMEQKLSTIKSTFPAVTHVDFSCRIQTVGSKNNPKLWDLLKEFKTISGYALLINTSFNIRGEPIVCTPDEAYSGFMRTGMDVLVMNNFVFLKEDQPAWEETENINRFIQHD